MQKKKKVSDVESGVGIARQLDTSNKDGGSIPSILSSVPATQEEETGHRTVHTF